MYSLRQKTYGIFIRPYIQYGGDRLVQRGTLSVPSPCQNRQAECTAYVTVKDGENWVLYKGEYFTSFSLLKLRTKEVMDTLGYSKNDIRITEIIPLDHIITPLV